MENIIAVFNNRNQAMQFASILRRLGITSKTVSTPRELSVSCGISIVFNSKNLGQAKMVLDTYRLSSYVRLFVIGGDLFRKYKPI